MRPLIGRYWIAALLALPIGYGLAALALVSLAGGGARSFSEIHSWGIPGLAIGAVAILGALAAITVADQPLERSIPFRVLWGGLGAGAAIGMACLMVSALDGFSGGFLVVYFALILAIPAGVTAALLIGLSDAAAVVAHRRRRPAPESSSSASAT